MNAKQKIKYVRDLITEKAQISPSGPFRITFYTTTEYEEGPTLISFGEQVSILRKLEEEGFVKNVQRDETNERTFWLEMVSAKKAEPVKARQGNTYSHIKTVDDFLQHRELVEQFRQIAEAAQIKPNCVYKIPTSEKNDGLIQLLIDLKIVEYDWSELKKQTHRDIGSRIIEFHLDGNKWLQVYDRVSGKHGRVKRDALELIAKDIGERFTFNKIVQRFADLGIPESMFVLDTKWRAVFYVLSYYTTSKEDKTFLQLLKIIQAFLHPLAFAGDEEQAKLARAKYKKWLKHDRILIEDDGKVYLGPSEEDIEHGFDDTYISADGELIEPKGYVLFPDHLAKLWVLWNQVILLVSAYHANRALDRKELDKLYLEIMGQAEDLIQYGKLFKIKDTYKRPITSLATAEIEARAKGVNDPVDLVNPFLLEIAALKPDPQEIIKEMEKNEKLIERVSAATKAIDGDKINFREISYEQAIFLLRFIMGGIQNVLDAVSSGYISMADENLNAKYITLSDYLEDLMQRNDFQKLKEALPPDLPEHLYESFGDMDIWWENGGQQGMMRFIGDVEKAWVRAGQQTFPMPGWLIQFFNSTDLVTAEHRKQKAVRWDRMLKNIDEKRSKGEIPFSQPQQVQPPVQLPVQKIEITAMPEVPVRFIGNTPLTQNKNREAPIELAFPEPVQWEKVALKIKEGKQEIEVLYDKSHIITADYIRLGFFSGKRQQKPDRRWGFLCALATLAATDIKQATAENMCGMITQGKTLSVNNVQQVKKSFVEQLQIIFKTRDDPFQDRRDYYEPKFAILPEPSLRCGEVWPQGGRLNENRGNEADRLAYEEKRLQEESEA
jgi:hypothetical protein